MKWNDSLMEVWTKTVDLEAVMVFVSSVRSRPGGSRRSAAGNCGDLWDWFWVQVMHRPRRRHARTRLFPDILLQGQFEIGTTSHLIRVCLRNWPTGSGSARWRRVKPTLNQKKKNVDSRSNFFSASLTPNYQSRHHSCCHVSIWLL